VYDLAVSAVLGSIRSLGYTAGRAADVAVRPTTLPRFESARWYPGCCIKAWRKPFFAFVDFRLAFSVECRVVPAIGQDLLI